MLYPHHLKDLKKNYTLVDMYIKQLHNLIVTTIYIYKKTIKFTTFKYNRKFLIYILKATTKYEKKKLQSYACTTI